MSALSNILSVTLDDASIIRRTPEVEHERRVAMYDLVDCNQFALKDPLTGPYHLFISVADNRLSFFFRSESVGVYDARQGRDIRAGQDPRILLPLQPFRGIIKDYFMICESYYDAIKHASPDKIETIDMARRGIHNEGSTLLHGLMKDKAEMDFETARRLFTLICVLHIK